VDVHDVDGWVGSACQYSNSTTCSGHGTVDALGSCMCAPPSGWSEHYGNFTGADCSGKPPLLRGEDEQLAGCATAFLWIAIFAAPCLCWIVVVCSDNHWEEADWRGNDWDRLYDAVMIFVSLLRTCDNFCFWYFFAVTLRDEDTHTFLEEQGLFCYAYKAEGGDFDAVWGSSLALCIVGTILVQLDCCALPFQWREVVERLMLLKDVPQLYLQVIYFGTLGFGNADRVAKVSFYCTCTRSFISPPPFLCNGGKSRRCVLDRHYAGTA